MKKPMPLGYFVLIDVKDMVLKTKEIPSVLTAKVLEVGADAKKWGIKKTTEVTFRTEGVVLYSNSDGIVETLLVSYHNIVAIIKDV